MLRSALLPPLSVLALHLAPPAAAQHTWTGASGTSWHTPGNWSPASVPTAAQTVTVGPGGNQPSVGSAAACAALTVLEGATVTLSGGDLAVGTEGVPGVLDLQWSGSGSVTTGRVLVSSASSELRLAGTWTQDHPEAVVTTAGWIELLGATVAGPASPRTARVRLVSGVTTLLVDLAPTIQLLSIGGTSAGPGTFAIQSPGVTLVDTLGFVLHRLRLEGGELQVNSSSTARFAALELVSGKLGIHGTGGLLDVLEEVDCSGVIGDPTGGSFFSGTLRFHGEWSGAALFGAGNLWVEAMDGATFAGPAPRFERLRLPAGTVQVQSDTRVDVELRSTGGVSAGPASFLIAGPGITTVDTQGFVLDRLRLDGGELQVSSSSTTRIRSLQLVSGKLGIHGTGGLLDVVGDVTCSGSIGDPTGGSFFSGTLSFHGTWNGSAPFGAGNLWVEAMDGATIGGVSPRFERLRLPGGTVQLLSDTRVDVELRSTGGVSSGSAAFLIAGPGITTVDTQGVVLDRLRLDGGELQVNSGSTTRIRSLQLVSGKLGIHGTGGLLEVVGDVTCSGSVGDPTGGSFFTGILRFHGTWNGSAPFGAGNLWVEAMDGAAIGGSAPRFERLRLPQGTISLLSDARIDVELQSTGGQSSGPAAFAVAGPGSAVVETQGFVIHRLRLEGGELLVNSGGLVRVQHLQLVGGKLGIHSTGGVLEVLEQVLCSGIVGDPSSGPHFGGTLRCLGDWIGSAPFVAGNLWVEAMEGTTISGTAPAFERLRIVGAGVEVSANTQVTESLDLEPGSSLQVLGANLDLLQTSWIETQGRLAIGPGAALRRPPTSTTDLNLGCILELAGTPVAPARIASTGAPGADFEVRGQFSAVNFAISGLSSAGLELDSTATLGPAGFRDGSFDSGVGGAGSRLLTVTTSAGFTASNVAFANSSGLTAFNVRRPAGPEVAFLNWSGPFGGPDHEDDPGTNPPSDPDGSVVWVESNAPDLRLLAVTGPTKAVGGESIDVDWTVINQGGADALVPWSERLVLSTDTVIDGGDLALATLAAPGNLASAGEALRSLSVSVPTGLDGEYYLGVIVDSASQVDEPGAEENNFGYQFEPLTITPEPRPDVVAVAIALPSNGEEGESLQVQWTVLNDGTGVAQPVASGGGIVPPWKDSLFLSLDQTFSAGDLFLGSFDAPVASLGVDQSYQNSQLVTLPHGLSGPRYVIVRVDAQNGIPEGLQEANNLKASPLLTVQQFDLPDLVSTGIALTSSFGAFYSGTTATATVTVTNQDPDFSDKGTANGLWYDRLWLSADATLGGDTLLANQPFSGILGPGAGYTFQRSFPVPVTQQTWYLIAELDRTGTLNEAAEGNNLTVQPFDVIGASYSATVATEFTAGLSATAPRQVLVPLTGQAFDVVSGVPVANAELTVRVRHKGSRRVYPVTTDGNGDFTFVFEPLIGEAGLFELYADHPAVLEDPQFDLQDSFQLATLAVAPKTVTAQLDVGETVNGTVQVHNPGDLPVTGLAVAVTGLPAHLTLSPGVLPTSLPPYGSATLTYQLSAVAEAPVPAVPAPAGLALSLDLAGASTVATTVALPTFVSSAVVQLVATENQMDAPFGVSVPTGQFSTFQLAVTNQGGATATNLAYDVPCEGQPGFLNPASAPCGFLFVPVTPTALGNLAPGATVVIEVGFVPSPALSVGTQIQSGPGSQILVTSNQGTVAFDYHLVVDSSATGQVELTVVDELSYWNASGELLSPPVPGLAGAAVELRRFGDPQTFYTGTSNGSGQVELFDAFGGIVGSEVRVGTYTVQVQAEDHGGYSAVIQVGAGQTVELLVFLPFEAVTYSFDVVPTEVDDVYDITLQADFNVVVPVPKLLIEPQLFTLDLLPGEVRQIDLTLTNLGLITAFGLELFLDDLQPGFTVDPLITELGDLPGGATIVVPVVISRSPVGSELACSYVQVWGVRHYLAAPDFLKWYWTPLWYTAPVGICPPGVSKTQPPPNLPPPTDPPPGVAGGGGAGGGSGGAGGGGSGSGSGPSQPAVTPPPPVQIPTGCEES